MRSRGRALSVHTDLGLEPDFILDSPVRSVVGDEMSSVWRAVEDEPLLLVLAAVGDVAADERVRGPDHGHEGGVLERAGSHELLQPGDEHARHKPERFGLLLADVEHPGELVRNPINRGPEDVLGHRLGRPGELVGREPGEDRPGAVTKEANELGVLDAVCGEPREVPDAAPQRPAVEFLHEPGDVQAGGPGPDEEQYLALAQPRDPRVEVLERRVGHLLRRAADAQRDVDLHPRHASRPGRVKKGLEDLGDAPDTFSAFPRLPPGPAEKDEIDRLLGTLRHFAPPCWQTTNYPTISYPVWQGVAQVVNSSRYE